jgi:ABC-2 type transport system permease protein
MGWVEQLRPLASPQPLLLLPIAGLIAVLSALAIHLAGARDLGASLIADRSSAPPHTGLLSGPTGLAIRLTRGVVTGWAVGIGVLGLLMGLIATSVGSALSEDAGDRETFAKLGFRGSGAEQYLAITFLIVALMVGLVAAGQITAARSEEADGRVDHLLARPLSRYTWVVSRLLIATGYLVVAGVIAGLTSWLGEATQHTGVSLPTMLGAGLNVVPGAVLVLGIGALTLGVWPRAVPAVTYGVLAWSFLVDIVGGSINVSHWVLDTSVFHQMAAAPAARPDWTSGAVLLALGAAAAALGAVAFRYRDLAGE